MMNSTRLSFIVGGLIIGIGTGFVYFKSHRATSVDPVIADTSQEDSARSHETNREVANTQPTPSQLQNPGAPNTPNTKTTDVKETPALVPAEKKGMPHLKGKITKEDFLNLDPEKQKEMHKAYKDEKRAYLQSVDLKIRGIKNDFFETQRDLKKIRSSRELASNDSEVENLRKTYRQKLDELKEQRRMKKTLIKEWNEAHSDDPRRLPAPKN